MPAPMSGEIAYILALVMREAAGADDCWVHEIIGIGRNPLCSTRLRLRLAVHDPSRSDAPDTHVFKGPNAVRTSSTRAGTPTSRWSKSPATLNPFAGDRVRIFAKLMTFTPLGNVKALPAYNMMREHHRRGELDGVTRAVENSSGNTVFSSRWRRASSASRRPCRSFPTRCRGTSC